MSAIQQRLPDPKASAFAPAPAPRAAVPAPAVAPLHLDVSPDVFEDQTILPSAPATAATAVAAPPRLTVDPAVFREPTLAPVNPAATQQLFGHLTDGPTAPSVAPSIVATPAVVAATPAVAAPAPVVAPAVAPATTAAPAPAGPVAAGTTPVAVPKPRPTVGDYGSGIDKQIDGLILGNRTTRGTLDAEKKAGAPTAAATEHALDGSRHELLDELKERSGVFDGDISAISTQLGGKVPKNPTPEQKALLDQMGQLVRSKEKYSDQQTALQRWDDRNQINSINEQLANPALDPKTKADLLAHKKTLSTGLLSTVKHYEQFDPTWGNTVYGKDKSYTSMRAAGCGPTGLADLLDFADQENPEGKHAQGIKDAFNPRNVADYATHHGRVKGSGTDGHTMMADLPQGFPGFASSDVASNQAAATSLHNGVPVMFLGHNISGQGGDGKKIKPYGGHYMVLSGVSDDNQTFAVTDGGRNNSRNMHSITDKQLTGHTAGMWTAHST